VQQSVIPSRASSSTKAAIRSCWSTPEPYPGFPGAGRVATVRCLPPLVLLHGFAGAPRHWRGVLDALGERFEAHPLELARAVPLTPDGVAALVAGAAPGRFVLAGYSMGGRLALHAALAMPERVERLVLVSASAGISDGFERASRAAADEELATQIERAPIEEFVARWAAVPLFADDPPWLREEVAAEQCDCDPAVLAACLRSLGAGAMAPVWDRLGELAMDVAVLAGERDSRYVALGRRLASALPRAELTVVAGAGHRLALEAPAAVAAAICG
jgi:2-succinyl-6-hydroxy-2,4-cyclohexadiene-1-carboxylate synthase